MSDEIKVHRDYWGVPLAVGDEVAFITRAYRDFSLGIIEKLTPVNVTVKQNKTNRMTSRHPSCVIKKP